MPQKRKPVSRAKSKNSRSPSRRSEKGIIKVGNVSRSIGIAVGNGARASVTQSTGAGTDEIARIFQLLQQRAAQSPPGTERDVAKNALDALEAESRKGDKADEGSVQKWMNFLAETLPDVWDVAIDTFLNPIKGVSTVFRKIAERAKAERDAKKTQVNK